MTSANLRSLLKRYFSPESYLSIHMLVGFLLLLLCAGVFVSLAEDVSTNDPIVQFDSAVVNAIHADTSPSLIPIMLWISDVGNQLPLAVTVVLVVYCFWKRRWPDLLLFVLAVGGAQLIDALSKLLFHRVRPAFANPITLATGYSFPSGHAMGAMVFYGLLAYLLIRREKLWASRVLIAVTFVLVVGLVGFSRIYLGVHYPSDVVGGYTAGLAWLALTTSGVDIFRKWHLEQQHLANSPHD